jgi:hypothetical protein
MFPVTYELGFYIPEDDIPHSHLCENLRSYIIKISFCKTSGFTPVRICGQTRGPAAQTEPFVPLILPSNAIIPDINKAVE